MNPTELGGDSAASEKSLRREGQVHCGCPAQRLSERLKAALIGAKVARALWVADGGSPSTGGTSASRTVAGRLRGNVDRLGALGRVRARKRPRRGGQRDHDDDGGAFIARGLRFRYRHHKHSTRGYCRVPQARTQRASPPVPRCLKRPCFGTQLRRRRRDALDPAEHAAGSPRS